MSQITYRANLSAKSFPFISDNWGRTVIVPQYDNTFNRQVSSQEDVDRDAGIPQICYCHNVMPYQQGYQSIGYSQVVSGIVGTVFSYIFLARDETGDRTYIGVTNTGAFYVLISGVWGYKASYPVGLITSAHASGTTYIYIQGYGCIKYDFTTAAFVPVTLTGIDTTQAIGIATASGYLVCWDKSTVAWSSTIDPTDFVPDLTTGAGGGAPEGAKGVIVLCVSNSFGFIVYTSDNTVVGLYSGNSRYPFNFREIPSSGGISNVNQVSRDVTTGNHYAYTTSGMQLISTSTAQTILPEVTDFISGKLFEDYNETTDTFSTTTVSVTLQKAIAIVSDRYLVISYGVTSFTHALVYDIITKKWGKLKIPHVRCLEFAISSTYIIETPKDSIAFLQSDGTIKTVNFSVTSSNSSGVLILGKYQFVRQRLLTLDEVHVENVQQGAMFTLLDKVALDGKNTVNSPLTLIDSSGLYRKYGGRGIGINHTLAMIGAFNICSLVLVFHINGKR